MKLFCRDRERKRDRRSKSREKRRDKDKKERKPEFDIKIKEEPVDGKFKIFLRNFSKIIRTQMTLKANSHLIRGFAKLSKKSQD